MSPIASLPLFALRVFERGPAAAACLLLFSAVLFPACSPSEGSASQPSNDSSSEQAASTSDAQKATATRSSSTPFQADPSACRSDSVLRVDGGAGERMLVLRGGLAIPRINFNEQTDAGDVAKPGMTVCLADFPLSASDPWARPPAGEGAKIELRLFTGDNRPLEPGVYRSARQGNLQLGPMLYLDEETHPFAFPKIGRVLIHRVDEDRICGVLELQTISGLAMHGAFDVPVLAEEGR
jgi:hypothetical protein